jgi:hypothetical protein
MKQQARVVLGIALLVLAGAVAVIVVGLRSVGVIAELVHAQGVVEHQSGASPWSTAETSQRFRLGDAVRTGARALARVRFRGGGGIELRPLTTVRFSASRPGTNAPSLRIEQGEVQLQAEQALSLSTEQGVLRLERGGRVQLSLEEGTLRVRVALGRAVVERDGLGTDTLSEGASLELGRTPSPRTDAGAPRPLRATSTDAAGASRQDVAMHDAAEAVDASEDAVTVSEVEGGPSSPTLSSPASLPREAQPSTPSAADSSGAAELSVRAGESAAIHAPSLPVRVRIDLSGRCPDGASVAFVTGTRSRQAEAQDGGATFALPAGRYRYKLRCEGARGWTPLGTLSVDSWTGAAALPTRPALTDIELDGHQYTVHYQNLLPILRVSWPSAPPSPAGYALTLRDARGRSSTIDARAPSVTLESGQVSDGTLRLSMQARSGGARSPNATVTVLFDNAANAAQIREPRPGATLGATVRVEGTALSGSTVIAGATALPLDGQRRFSGEVRRGNEPSLVITIRHRASGTHYYVRRASP